MGAREIILSLRTCFTGLCVNRSYRALRFTGEKFEIRMGETGPKTKLEFKKSAVRLLGGRLTSAKLEKNELTLVGSRPFHVGIMGNNVKGPSGPLRTVRRSEVDGEIIDIYYCSPEDTEVIELQICS